MLKLTKKLLLSLIVAITVFNGTSLAFDDVKPTDSFYYAVEHLRRNKVIVDGKKFQPELILSKAEFIKYLVKINNPEFIASRTAELPYNDTKNSAWYASYYKEAIDLGILDAKDKKGEPYNKLNLPEALEILFHSKSIPIPHKHIGNIPFEDLQKNEAVAPLVMRAMELGIVKPEKNDYFGIYKKINRAQAADLIFQMEMLNVATYEGQQTSSGNIDLPFELKKIVNAWELVKSNFVDRDSIDEKEMSKSAINALLKTLNDPYSVYLDATENQSFTDEIEGKFEGIGAYISFENEKDITIVSPIKNGPAYKAGLKPGDIIREVDGWKVEGYSLQQVVARIKGPKGTDVTLTLERDGSQIKISVTRDTININAVETEVIQDGEIMHAKLITFNQNAAASMREVAEIISNSNTIKGLILDLRGNPGGLLDSAIEVIGLFVPKGSPAVKIQYNYFNVTQSTTRDGVLKNFPIVILIDKGSASASEIVAGALKELEIATVVGETSFGKGTVQEVNYFEDTSSIKMTVAKWFTPNGNSIQDNGVKPNVEVQNATGETGDRQLERAILELNKKIR